MATFGSGFTLVVLAAVLGAAGCASENESGPDVGESQGAWGHLALDPASPQFLVNKRPGQTWRGCVPRYMTTTLPGIEAEIEAAVNVWASYLDRHIDVQLEVKDLPRATAGQSPYDLSAAYHAACGDGFDAVFGLADLEGATMGVTSGKGTVDADGHWASFQRFVFLRDFAIAPDDVDGASSTWASYATNTGSSLGADALLAKMRERSATRYVEGGRRTTLPVVVHEIGHVWGLCDQYEGATNCDPQNSTSHIVTESIMGPSTLRERMFLTDDDVAGIRALARRPGFDARWPAPPTTPAAPVATPPVELFRLDRVARTNGQVVLDMGIVTNAPVRLEIAYRRAGGSEWNAFTPMDYDGRTDAPLLGMTLPVDAVTAAGRVEVRASLSVRSADGALAPVKTLAVSE